jgi:hypothetical protein
MTEKASTKLTKYTFDAEEVSKSFTPFRVKKEEVEKNLLELKVEDEISLNSAQMTFNRGKEIQDEIVKFSAELKAPFTETANRIQSYFNAFVSPLTKNLEIAGNKILNYKTMEAEKVKEAANKQLEDVSNEFKQNKDNFDKLEKLCVISVCRIFGGSAVVGGKETLFTQLNSVEAAQHMRKVFEEKFPNPDTFGKFAANVIMAKELAIQSINEIEIGLKGTGYDFNLGKIKLEEKFQVELKKEIKQLEKENKLQVKTIGKSVQSVMKGTRKTIDYELIDITKVPLTYLCLDEKKVDDYLATHREELKQMLATHESVEAIKGVKFFNNVKVVKS